MQRRFPTSIRLTPAEREALDALSKSAGRSRSEVVVRMIRQAAPPPPGTLMHPSLRRVPPVVEATTHHVKVKRPGRNGAKRGKTRQKSAVGRGHGRRSA